MMRRRLLLAAALSACACGAPKPAQKTLPVVQSQPQTLPDNLEIDAYEVVESPERDWPARVRVYVDRSFVGQTEEAPRSREKRWSGRVPEGNRLVRLEYWTFPRVWDWVKSSDDNQPPERFVRV